jgi:hypothetical protein
MASYSSTHPTPTARANAAVGQLHNEVPAVIFPSYPQIPWPCFPVISDRDRAALHRPLKKAIYTDRGMVFIKLLKVASTTAVGIHLRLADREAQRQRQQPSAIRNSSLNNTLPAHWSNGNASSIIIIEKMCLTRFHHGLASHVVHPSAWPHAWTHPINDHPNRISETQSTATWRLQRAAQLRVWTMVREPTTRALSQFFFSQTIQSNREPTMDRIIAFLRNLHLKPHSHYRTWLNTGTRASLKEWNDHGPEIIHQILTDFDFIGVTERFDESVVVLSFLWHIPLGDLLYLSSPKARGTWTTSKRRNAHECFIMTEPPMSILQSPQLQDYLQSSEWRDRVYWDQQIYQSAVSSLDATIASLGVDRVQARLTAFRAAQAAASHACPPDMYQPCYPNGTIVTTSSNEDSSQCYLADMGCGHVCLDIV